MISFSKLFYLGLLSGLLNKIPFMDLGTLFYCLTLNKEIFLGSWKKSVTSIGIICFGYFLSILLPLNRLNLVFISYVQIFMSFFCGFILYSCYQLWRKSSEELTIKILFQSMSVAVLGIISFKLIPQYLNFENNYMDSFLSGLTVLIPSVEYRTQSFEKNIFHLVISFIGFFFSVFLLRKYNETFQRKQQIFSAFLMVSIVSFWPWKSTTLSINEGANEYEMLTFPALPDDLYHLVELGLVFLIGCLLSWIFHKIQEKSVRLIHEK